jgi:hypothetical protein
MEMCVTKNTLYTLVVAFFVTYEPLIAQGIV